MGVAFMLISAALYALHLPINQRVLYDVPAPTVTVYTLLAMSAIVVPSYFILDGSWPAENAPWAPVLGLSAVTFFSRLMLFQTSKRLIPNPPVPIPCSFLLLGESLTTIQWIGTGGLGISLLLVWFEKPAIEPAHTHGLLSWLQPPEFPADFYKH